MRACFAGGQHLARVYVAFCPYDICQVGCRQALAEFTCINDHLRSHDDYLVCGTYRCERGYHDTLVLALECSKLVVHKLTELARRHVGLEHIVEYLVGNPGQKTEVADPRIAWIVVSIGIISNGTSLETRHALADSVAHLQVAR